jgi:hypothetical protein
LAFSFGGASAFCGMLYHINKEAFMAAQSQGTLLFGGAMLASLVMAAIFDNFDWCKARYYAAIPAIIYSLYLIYIFGIMPQYSFYPFLVLQVMGLTAFGLCYLRQRGSQKARLINYGIAILIIASVIDFFSFHFLGLTSDDIFHLLFVASQIFLYVAIQSDQRKPIPPEIKPC